MPAARTTTQTITSPGGTSSPAQLTTPSGDPATTAAVPSFDALDAALCSRPAPVRSALRFTARRPAAAGVVRGGR